MKLSIFLPILAVAGIAMSPVPAAATQSGYTTGNVNMRAGPSTRYPKVRVLHLGSDVYIHGCVKNYSWCDVSGAGRRGWVSAAYLDVAYSNRRVHAPRYARYVGVPIITFEVGTYWDDYYSEYEFYEEVDVWDDYAWELEAYPPEWQEEWIEIGPDTVIVDDNGEAVCVDRDLEVFYEC